MTTAIDQLAFNPVQFWMRGERPAQPVEFDEASGMWNVYGFAEAQQVIADPRVFSSDTGRLASKGDVKLAGIEPSDMEKLTEGNLVQMDPPVHTRLRKIVSHAFTRKVVADLEPRIAEITRQYLDEAGDGNGRLELVSDLAYPLPITVIAELLGVPAGDRGLFKGWVDQMFSMDMAVSVTEPSEEQRRAMEVALAGGQEMVDYLAEHVRDRRVHPREDLITQLVQADVDGERLNDNQVTNFANVLLVAGHITTTMLLGNTILCLDAYPDTFRRVRQDRSLVPSAIEESLRLFSPFAAVGRATTADVELGGVQIPQDQMLMVWIAAANRDGREFANPNEFDPGREPNHHLGFGRGVHFCLGAPLARLEGRVALNLLLDRYSDIRTDPDDAPDLMPSPNMTGVNRLPLLVSR